MKIKFKIWRVTFLKKFLTIKKFGLASAFQARDDLPRAHWDETEFNYILADNYASNIKPIYIPQKKRKKKRTYMASYLTISTRTNHFNKKKKKKKK